VLKALGIERRFPRALLKEEQKVSLAGFLEAMLQWENSDGDGSFSYLDEETHTRDLPKVYADFVRLGLSSVSKQGCIAIIAIAERPASFWRSMFGIVSVRVTDFYRYSD
jgi:hypothetical protein